MKFKNGDVVRFKGNGPGMVVVTTHQITHKYTCRWFDVLDKINEAIFNEEELCEVKEFPYYAITLIMGI